jgi:uncharacterized protein YtpQ (UPF0354 family)
LKPKVERDESRPWADLEFGDAPVAQDFGCGLAVLYVVDEGQSLVYVQTRDLVAEEATPETLHDVAIQNLRTLAQSRLEVRPYGSIYATFLDGNCEASLLVLDDIWDTRLREFVEGDYVAAAPARDVLAFCGADSQLGVAELRAVVDRVYRPNQRHMLTPHLLCRRNRSWVLYDGAS